MDEERSARALALRASALLFLLGESGKRDASWVPSNERGQGACACACACNLARRSQGGDGGHMCSTEWNGAGVIQSEINTGDLRLAPLPCVPPSITSYLVLTWLAPLPCVPPSITSYLVL
jgi:hypothetical protein